MKNRRTLSLGGLAIVLLAGTAAAQPFTNGPPGASLSVSLAASVTSPAPVGTIVTWTASVAGTSSTNLWYRFQARETATTLGPCHAVRGTVAPHGCATDFSMVQDFGPVNALSWTASDHEGGYEVQVTATDNDSGATAVASAVFQFTPRVTGSTPVVSTTANPLVFLYSAPSCPAGSTMSVQFQAPDGFLQNTNSKPCDGRTTMNFYLAGMRAQTLYSIRHTIQNGSQAVTGPVLTQATPNASTTDGPYTVAVLPPATAPNPVVLQARFGWPVATDLMGNLLWYSAQDISIMSRPEPGGLFLGWFEGSTYDTAHQILEEFDLAGTVLRETNAARVNQQLAAIGMHPITTFHHEVRALPDGSLLVLGATERILTGVQGPGPVDVLGDIILVLDPNLQVSWAWDTFDHLDPHRLATLNETCTAVNGGCPPILLAPQANDWTHGNCLELTADGSILYSARHQDWVIKIDYGNGQGTGNILWRLGKDGDFQFISSDPYPWFSHQHDANIDANGVLTVFDNGNVRNASDPTAPSRGQVIQVDEVNHTATLLVNAYLGDFSIALGSAQSLPDGNYHFHLGYITKNTTARIVEVDPAGNFVYDMHVGEIEYRSFRMRDLYTTP
jgi:hypothetical protein